MLSHPLLARCQEAHMDLSTQIGLPTLSYIEACTIRIHMLHAKLIWGLLQIRKYHGNRIAQILNAGLKNHVTLHLSPLLNRKPWKPRLFYHFSITFSGENRCFQSQSWFLHPWPQLFRNDSAAFGVRLGSPGPWPSPAEGSDLKALIPKRAEEWDVPGSAFRVKQRNHSAKASGYSGYLHMLV